MPRGLPQLHDPDKLLTGSGARVRNLILMAAVGMIFMAQSTNLVMILVGLELLSVSVYVLTGFHGVHVTVGVLRKFVLELDLGLEIRMHGMRYAAAAPLTAPVPLGGGITA